MYLPHPMHVHTIIGVVESRFLACCGMIWWFGIIRITRFVGIPGTFGTAPGSNSASGSATGRTLPAAGAGCILTTSGGALVGVE